MTTLLLILIISLGLGACNTTQPQAHYSQQASPRPITQGSPQQLEYINKELAHMASELHPGTSHPVALGKIDVASRWQPLAQKLLIRTMDYLIKKRANILTFRQEALLAHLQKESSDLYQGTTSQAGELQNAHYLITGEVIEEPASLQFSLRLIEVKTGKISKSTLSQLPKVTLPTLPEEFPAYQQAHRLRQEQNWQQALALYQKTVSHYPEYGNAYFFLGFCYDQLGQKNLALAAYSQAIRLNSHDSSAFNYRGMLYHYHFQIYDKAKTDYLRAIELDPNNAYAYSNLGVLYTFENEYQQALKAHQNAVNLRPQEPELVYNLACTQIKTGDIAKAYQNLERALQLGLDKSIPQQDSDMEEIRGEYRFQKLME